MKKYAATGISLSTVLVFVALLLWAATTDLVPVTPDIQQGWGVVAGCTDDSDQFECINEGVSGHDGDTSTLSATDVAAATDEYNLTDAPGDHVSTNTITLNVVVRVEATNDENDRIDFTLEVSGTPSGGVHCANDSGTGCTCNINGTTYTECNFTDSAWNSLSTSDIDNLSLVATTVNDASGMPDTTTFRFTAADLTLDYSNVAGAPRVIIIGD